jgi:hypothetical protein
MGGPVSRRSAARLLHVSGGDSPVFGAYGMVVLTLEGDRISGITRFVDNSLMSWFGLPSSLAE